MKKTHSYRKIYKIALAWLVVLTIYTTAAPEHIFAAVAAAPVSARENARQDREFEKKFTEGRNLIDKQEWAKAAEKFSEVVKDYPAHKSADAALYWLAFCYKKQRDFEKMGAAVDRLLKDYPQSSWTGDARVLLIEVGANGGTLSGIAPGSARALSATRTLSGAATAVNGVNFPVYDNSYVFAETFDANSKTALDREDEIRLAAFRSLLSADRQKALDAVSQILRSDSKSSETLKIEVLRALRRPQGFSGYSISTGGEFFPLGLASTVKSAPAEKASAAPLRELLVRAFRENSNARIRREIIYTLASLRDEAAISKLVEIYDSESDVEVKKSVIGSLSPSNFVYRSFGASSISRATAPAAALSDPNSAESATRTIALNKLLEIVRTEKNPELRRLALSSVQKFGGWNKNGQTIEMLSRIYDSETDEIFKKSIIQSFARINDPQTTKKLIEIAGTEKSDSLKLEAIRALGQSKSPEALKYLEEIIK